MGGSVSSADAVFGEAAAESRVAAVPLSHLSVEVGHLYMEDFAGGRERLRRHFERVRPWAETARRACAERSSGRKPRVSTCFLVDDYFARFSSPAQVVPELMATAEESGTRIDYLARESACAEADGVSLARLVESRLVADPAPDTNGSRPPATEAGWLCNGQRSPTTGFAEAMGAVTPWAPPVQNAARRHSIFLDVELWDEIGGRRTWSCPFLAAVWQLLRLGMLRNFGESVVTPRRWKGAFPEHWDELPPVVQLNPTASPFSAYRTFSVLSSGFLPVEHAVRTILSQAAIDPRVLEQIRDRSGAEGVEVPREVVDRIDYVFVGEA